MAPTGDGVTGAVPVSGTATGSGHGGGTPGGLEPSSCPIQALGPGGLGRLWGADLDGAPALSAEAVGERMYGNPIAPAVPEPGKVHIVRNLPGFSSC